MRVPQQVFCDVCGKTLDSSRLKVKIYVKTHYNWINNYPIYDEALESVFVDICDECLLKGTNFVCDFRGQNLRFKDEVEE